MRWLQKLWHAIDTRLSIRAMQLIYIVVFCIAAIAFTYR